MINPTVCVCVLHRTGRNWVRWCAPVGWEPALPGDPPAWPEEETGCALLLDAAEGEEIEVPLCAVWWMRTRDGRSVGPVRLPKEGE